MPKSRHLFLLLFMLTLTLNIKIYAVSNSLIPGVQNSSVKQKVSVTPKISIALLQTDTNKVLKQVDHYLHLPSDQATNKQKARFIKKIAILFETNNDFKHALLYYKTADSLAKTPDKPLKVKIVHPQNSSPYITWPLYLFVFVSIIGVSLLIYVWYWRKQTLSAIKKLEMENAKIKVETDDLQTDLDKKIKAETGDLQIRLEKLRQKELALKTALKKAEEASYLRNAFIANLGFDVRTPLNGIIGFANMLETELAVREKPELFEYASNIKQSGSQLLKLMDNIIDFSSLEANTLELKVKPVSLEKILQSIYNQNLEHAHQKNLIFKIKIDEDIHPVLADAKGLEKAIYQIVDNAIRYTEQGFVTISGLYEPEKDIDIVEIKDTGPGIEKTKQKSLFNLEQADETKDPDYSQGTGIGLKLAKKLIDFMQGRLELESTPGKGTAIRLIIPCSNKAIVAPEKTPEAGITEGKEISTVTELGELDTFVVEDDRMNRIILEKMLSKFGKVTLTVDGEDCMKTIDKEAQLGHFYQIMLFDINLPGDWDGVKLMKEIRRKYPEYKHIPFIAQTAYAMAGDKSHFLKEGFDSYLSKPIDKNELITTIKQQLNIFGNSNS